MTLKAVNYAAPSTPIIFNTAKTIRCSRSKVLYPLIILLLNATPVISKPNPGFLSTLNSSYFDKVRQETTANRFHNRDLTMRAWTCHGRTQREMVEKLAAASIIKSDQVRQCLLRVDRANYAPERSGAYTDAPQPIGYGQTISAPHMHAHTLEEIMPSLISASMENPDTPLSILDVGCGSGYLTAALGRLVDKGPQGPISPLVSGTVHGIDVVPELVDMTRTNMKKKDADLFNSGTVNVQVGDGWKGLPDKAPFHAIHVGAAADDFPENLMMQLAVGGVMVIPVGPDGGFQNLYRVEKLRDSPSFHSEDFVVERLLGVRYVPLVHVRP